MKDEIFQMHNALLQEYRCYKPELSKVLTEDTVFDTTWEMKSNPTRFHHTTNRCTIFTTELAPLSIRQLYSIGKYSRKHATNIDQHAHGTNYLRSFTRTLTFLA